MPGRQPLALCGGLLAGLLLVTGCSGGSSPDHRPVVLPTAPASSACATLLAHVPATLGSGLARRTVTPDDATTAAWGSPPVTLRCGAAAAGVLDDVYTLDGVGWSLHDDGASNRWTTTGKGVPVAVSIPDRYDSQADLLTALGPAVLASR